MSDEMRLQLEALATRWEGWANAKQRDALLEKTVFGKRFILNGEICYRNCVRELRELLSGLSCPADLQPTTTVTLSVPKGCSIEVTETLIAEDPESVAAGVARKEFHIHLGGSASNLDDGARV